MRNSKKWQAFMLAGVFSGALFFAPTAFAQSLWADAAEGTSYGVFADRKAHNVGDTLTTVLSAYRPHYAPYGSPLYTSPSPRH